MKTVDQDLVFRVPRLVQYAQVVTVAAVYLASYQSVLLPLVREWREHENFSYGILIPLIFLYLIWQEREVFEDPSIVPSYWGALSLFGAVVIGIIGSVVGEPFVSRVSFVLAMGALFHLFFGWWCVRRLAFPLSYLFLMVPPPYVIVKEVSYHLRMFDAYAASNLLQAAGIPNYRDAYFLHLPNITLEVADVCSGIASLFAMLALGTIYVYYLPARKTAKLVVLSGLVIFPMIANLFRIFLVGASVYYYGPIMLGAFFHHFTGTFTFLLSVGMLVLLGEHCRRSYPEEAVPARLKTYPHTLNRQKGWRSYPFVIAVVVLASAMALSNGILFSPAEMLASDIDEISRTLGPYQEAADEWSEHYSDSNAEKSLLRLYATPGGPPIETFVGYVSGQLGNKRLTSPKLVFPNGWEYAAMEPVEIQMPGGKSIGAIWLVIKKGDLKRAVLYWYQVRGKSFASDLRNRVELSVSLLLHRRTYSAVVRLATPIRESEDAVQVKERLAAFSAYLYPELIRVLP